MSRKRSGQDQRKISDEDLLTHARETGNTAYHPMGTCRMGSADRIDSVVDDQLRVHGIEGLRVADASIMPTILSANLNAGALMIGEKAADLLIARARNRNEEYRDGGPQDPHATTIR